MDVCVCVCMRVCVHACVNPWHIQVMHGIIAKFMTLPLKHNS